MLLQLAAMSTSTMRPLKTTTLLRRHSKCILVSLGCMMLIQCASIIIFWGTQSQSRKSSTNFEIMLPSQLALQNNQLTVVVTTYKDSLRNPCVIGQWLPLSDIVREIIVVWDVPVSRYLERVSNAVANYTIPVRFITHMEPASLNNRYTIYNEIHTNAVFAIDDDIRIRHMGVRAAFEEWKQHPDLMINFSRQEVGYNGEKYYYEKHWMTNWNQSSTLGLTLAGGTVVHKRYYELYAQERDAMEFVDQVHNGEDILMNWVIAKDLRRRNISSGVAVYMYPFFPTFPHFPNPENQTFEATGISTRKGHFEKRDACIEKFVEIFGFSLDRRNEWSVGWLPGCTLEKVTCRFPFSNLEPRLDSQRCEYSLELARDQ